MSTNQFTELSSRQVTEHWWIALVEGIAVFIAGLLLLAAPVRSLLLMQLVGLFFLVSGIFSIIQVFVDSSRSRGWLIFSGIVGILAGIVVLQHPFWSAIFILASLAVMLGIAGLMLGIVNIIRGFQGEGIWSIVLGVIDIIIGIIVLANIVATMIWLPILLAVFCMIGGIALCVLAFRMRNQIPTASYAAVGTMYQPTEPVATSRGMEQRNTPAQAGPAPISQEVPPGTVPQTGQIPSTQNVPPTPVTGERPGTVDSGIQPGMSAENVPSVTGDGSGRPGTPAQNILPVTPAQSVSPGISYTGEQQDTTVKDTGQSKTDPGIIRPASFTEGPQPPDSTS